MAMLRSINPANNALVGEVAFTSREEIIEKVNDAQAVKKEWKMLGAKNRAEMLRPLITLMRNRDKEIGTLISQEMGKPITQSLEEVEDTLHYLQDFINEGPRYLDNETTVDETSAKNPAFHQIVFEPYGVAACIVAWNFPISNFVWGVIPNLIAGNPVVFKHSEECPLLGKLAEEIINELNLPRGVFSEIYGDGTVGMALMEQKIDLVWFVGSSKVGLKIFEMAGKKQIKSILEMGGSDPAIIFEDAKNLNLDAIVKKVISQRFGNSGQMCDATKRLIVHESLRMEFVDLLIDQLKSTKIDDPLNPHTQMGPLAAERQLHLLESQIADAVALGATVLYGGHRPEGLSGAYYLPTLVTDIKPDMRVWKEETFGPVLPIISFNTEEEAITLANDTIYGLSSHIFTADPYRAKRIATQLDAGSVNVNFASRWRSCNPFGGYKASGVGREHGRYGFQELCQLKVIAE